MIEQENVFVTERDVDWVDRTRTLVVCSKGVTSTQKRFVIDIFNLMPHSKRSAKLQKGDTLSQIKDLCELYECRNFMFFENRKRVNFFLWVGCFPDGPSMKFQLDNVVSSSDMKLQGNCLKSARHVLSFDRTFEVDPKWKIAAQLLTTALNIPLYHPKCKSVIDHVLSFTVDPISSACYFKNYQVFEQAVNKDKSSSQLYEMGPRFIMTPQLILGGMFSGDVLFRDKIVTVLSKKNMKSHKSHHHTVEDKEKVPDFSDQEFSDQQDDN